VPRRFGWDTHGVPVEHEIDKKLGITSRGDVLAMGIDKYNAECRAIVMRYSSEWRATVERMGRWIDFDDDYKTLNLGFMESVWWAFRQLFDKGLVYRGLKVMPYSTGLLTPLSNFEAGQNYKEVNDPAGACYCCPMATRLSFFSNVDPCAPSIFIHSDCFVPACGRPKDVPSGVDDNAMDASI
jgi:isoleucyl-tRNA synthetase